MMIKISKNIRLPNAAKQWVADKIPVIKRLIKTKAKESSELGILDNIILPERLEITREHDDQRVRVVFKISPEALFYANNWLDEDGVYAAWADAAINSIYLNADKLLHSSDKALEFTILHELVHIIDPKLYREELNIGMDNEYYKRPHEIDALSTEMSEILRYKYTPEQLLEMLRSGEIDRLPNKHKALGEFSEKDLRRFKLNLYHDIMMDIQEEE